ncbi:MAG TPA: sodium:solute symporter family protein [Rhodothermales bacterium]|nr:sodium:solute symporter family protein [Rhodothermales bacterium]
MDIDPVRLITQFSAWDWGIVAIYIASIGYIGIHVNRYIHNVADYMVGGRASRWALNTASYVGTELGLVTVMYAAMDGFSRGFAFLIMPLIGMVATFYVGQSGLVINRLREMELLTLPEFFQKRFGKEVRVTAGIIMALSGILNMGLFPKMGAVFVTYVTGLAATPNAETVVNIVMTGLIILVLVYTVMGGMVAVIITDYMQFVLLSLGLLTALGITLMADGSGWTDMVGSMVSAKGVAGFNPVHANSYGWAFVLWMVVTGMAVGFTWGTTVSRALTAESPRVAQKTYMFGAPGMFVRMAIPALIAIGAFAHFSGDPEFAAYFFPSGVSEAPAHPAQAMPLFLGKLLPVGLLGIVVAGLLAAFMSTHDSYFLCWASVISRDVISPLKGRPMSDREEILNTRIIIVLIGIFLLVWGLWYDLPESVWTYMAITGTIYVTGAASAIVGGIYWKRASSTGAMAALLGGLLSVAGLFLEPIQEVLPWLSVGVLGLSNFFFCAVLLVVFSLLFPDKDSRSTPDRTKY